MHHSNHGLRIALLAGASVVALAVAAPSAGAADMNKPMPMKAPPALPVAKDTWTWWIEGGAFSSAGDSENLGTTAGAIRPNWGPEGAIGFDWQPFAPMHVIGQFRYGEADRSGSFGGQNFSATGVTTITPGTGHQSLREDHWLIDFAIGRDFGVGIGHAEWMLGVRIADLRAKLTGNALVTGATTTPTFTTQRTTFVGAGPRLGAQGDIPLGGQWSLDWLAGVAVLVGERNIQSTTFTPTPPLTTITIANSDTVTVFNVDAQAGLSYWFSPSTKISASYRFDGYFHALRANSPTNQLVNVDRFYNGPMVRLTTKF